MKANRGFTLIEVVIVIVLIGIAATIAVMSINLAPIDAKGAAAQVKSDLATIEIAMASYNQRYNNFPAGLTDATFVPAYLMPPRINALFDSAYGTNGYQIDSRTGQPAGQNGYFVLIHTTVTGATDEKFLALKKLAAQLPPTKFYYNTTAPPAVSNMADPAGGAAIFGTYWVTRY